MRVLKVVEESGGGAQVTANQESKKEKCRASGASRFRRLAQRLLESRHRPGPLPETGLGHHRISLSGHHKRSTMSGKYTLFHAEGCSSTVVEVAFKSLLQPNQFEIIELDYEETTHTKSNSADPNVQRMMAANPLRACPGHLCRRCEPTRADVSHQLLFTTSHENSFPPDEHSPP